MISDNDRPQSQVSNDATDKKTPKLKIGLALSGGGFRASIFHLGAIRRLEERGIMKNVSVISCVSGGSIVGAYYALEMERRHRERRAEYAAATTEDKKIAIRLELWAKITENFLAGVGCNVRNRAKVFAIFYHPLICLKVLWSCKAKGELFPAEYDRCFFHGATLDQLPPERRPDCPLAEIYAGPKLVLNTTSLLTGERVAFSRETPVGIEELDKPNRNVLHLSHVVGASACVPGVMSPTVILGDVLVDGGVSDNQGIEGLRKDYCDVVVVSDACGQLDACDSIGTSVFDVLPRVFSILQHRIRQAEIEMLFAETKKAEERREKAEGLGKQTKPEAACSASEPLQVQECAYIHLFLNLKDRQQQIEQEEDEQRKRRNQEQPQPRNQEQQAAIFMTVIPRIPEELIQYLGRIRTDLDQFSLIEQEALMYHGYTLVDAKIREHCGYLDTFGTNASMRTPPLFTPKEGKLPARAPIVQRELAAGRSNLLLARAWRKYCGLVAVICFIATVVWAAFGSIPFLLVGCLGHCCSHASRVCGQAIGTGFPGPVGPPHPTVCHGLALLGRVVIVVIWGYVVSFIAYNILRCGVAKRNRAAYRKLTDSEDSPVKWNSPSQDGTSSSSS